MLRRGGGAEGVWHGACAVTGSAAVKLELEGALRETVITARHRGSTIVAMRSTLAEAAKWTIEESDRGGLRKRLWRPFGMAGSSRDGVPENARGHVDVEDRPAAAAALLEGHMTRSGDPLVSWQV